MVLRVLSAALLGLLLAAAPAAARTITVDSLNSAAAPDGNCTLREAINAANLNMPADACDGGEPSPVIDKIVFNFTGNQTINLAAELPLILEPVEVRGDGSGGSRIELNGTSAGAAADGLRFATSNATANRSTVVGMVINRFGGDGVEVAAGKLTLTGSFIGTNAAGQTDQGNGGHGVNLSGGVAAIIGGDGGTGAACTVDCNTIAGNAHHGIAVNSAGAVIQGNHIGVNAAGTGGIGNTEDGVHVTASDATIGGSTVAQRNFIGANSDEGVEIDGAAVANARITGNFIGTTTAGTGDLGNSGDGVFADGTGLTIGGTAGVTVGGECTGECNLISGNNGDGVILATTSGAVIAGNYIGTRANGTQAVANGSGVRLTQQTEGTIVGGTTPQARNVVAGNTNNGITITGGGTNNEVIGNFVGVGSGGGALANGFVGILGTPGSIDPPTGTTDSNNTIGGDTPEAENLISNQPSAAIRIAGDGVDGYVVARNRGTDNGLFVDVGFPTGPGNTSATGANDGAQAPAVTAAGATAAKGTAPPGSTVRAFVTDDPAGSNVSGVTGFAGSATANASGQWTLTYPAPLTAADTIAASQTGVFGTSELSTATVVDAAPPETVINAGPAEGATTADSTPEIGFESEAGATFECSVDGGGFAACSSPNTLAALQDGAHSFSVRATDSSLNADPTPATRGFTVDTTPPDTQITSAPAALGRSKTVVTAFSATEAGSRFECSLDGGVFAACLSPDTRVVSEGAHTLAVRAVDAVGNVEGSPASASFQVDATRPVVSRLTLKKRVFRFRVTEAGRAVIKVKKRRVSKRVKAGSNKVAFAALKKLRPGRYKASLVVTDAAGNASKGVRKSFRVARRR